MKISTAFEKDVLSKNTQIIPLVIIEKLIQDNLGDPNLEAVWDKLFFSTHNIEVQNLYFNPLLTDIPKLKNSVDIKSGKVKSNSITLKLKNIPYNNMDRNRPSSILEHYNLTNARIGIYYKSQSCTTLVSGEESLMQNNEFFTFFDDSREEYLPPDYTDGCVRVFNGYIREISHDSETLTIKAEDFINKKIDKEVPFNIIGSGYDIPEKYRNVPYPMCFGIVESTPSIAIKNSSGDFVFYPDFHKVHTIFEESTTAGDLDWYNGGLKIHNDKDNYFGEYVNLNAIFQHTFLEPDDPEFYNHETVTASGLNRQYSIDSETNTVILYGKGMFGVVNRVECTKTGFPKDIEFWRVGFGSEGMETEQLFSEDDIAVIKDGSLDTSVNISEYMAFQSSVGLGLSVGTTYSHPAMSLIWNNNIGGVPSKFCKPLKTYINGISIPTPGDAAIGGFWDNSWQDVFVMDITAHIDGASGGGEGDFLGAGNMNWIADVLNDRNRSTFQVGMGNLINYMMLNGTFNQQNQGYTETDLNGYDPYLDNDFSIDTGYTNSDQSIHGEGDTIPFIRLSRGQRDDDIENRPMIAGDSGGEGLLFNQNLKSEWNSFEFWGSPYNNTDDAQYSSLWPSMDFDLDFREIHIHSIINITDASEQTLYINAKGRLDEYLANYDHVDYNGVHTIDVLPMWADMHYVTNPADIFRNIAVEELNIPQGSGFNEREFNLAFAESYWGWNGGDMSFSQVEKINAKNLFSEISKSSMLIPRMDSEGKFGFFIIPRKIYYEPQVNTEWNNYIDSTEISAEDIINYKYKMTSSNDIISGMNVSYKYSYAGDKFLNITDKLYMTDEELRFYGIEDREDSFTTFETKYRRTEASAESLRNYKFYNEKAPHLIIELTLPLRYISLETGDWVKFEKDQLLDGIKANGIDYTNPVAYGGVIRYPVFIVTEIQKGIDSVSVKLYQLHRINDDLQTGIDDMTSPGSAWIDQFPNADFVDPAYSSADDLSQEVIDNYPGYSDYLEDPIDIMSNNEFDNFLIGYSSYFQNMGYNWNTSYIRKIKFEEELGEFLGVDYQFNDSNGNWNNLELDYPLLGHSWENMFGLSRWDINDWNDLVPVANDDGTGYGTILNGGGVDGVKDFIAMEIKIENLNQVWRLQNVSGTGFDSDLYDPETTLLWSESYGIDPSPTISEHHPAHGWQEFYACPTDTDIGASETVLKLGWVGYHTDSQGEPDTVLWLGALIKYNMLMPDNIHIPDLQDYIIELYPHHRPFTDMTLSYTSFFSGTTMYDDLFTPTGDVNLDGTVDILDIVTLINGIMSDGFTAQQFLNADLNEDGLLNVFDIVLLVNLMLGNNP